MCVPTADVVSVSVAQPCHHAVQSGVGCRYNIHSHAARIFYLVAVMGWYSRNVLSWRLSHTLGADFYVAALEEFIEKYGCPEFFDTDQGCQVTSFFFTELLKEGALRIAMNGRGC